VRALVTGGAGFIGSNLCDYLISRGLVVNCLDNLVSGYPSNISHLLDHPNFEFTQGDVKDSLNVDVDIVFHLASPASPNPLYPGSYVNNPVATMLANSVGTFNFLELAKSRGARVLFASTSEVYGNPTVSPQPESYWGNVDPIGPRSCYDESKRFGEALATEYSRNGVDVRIVRIFNTYGPRCHPQDGRVVPAFINQALDESPITVHGNGTQTRSLCYVSDLVHGLWLAATSDAASHEVINLGNTDERSVLDYAILIKDLTGSRSEIVHIERPAGDISNRRPDISKAQRLLGWRPVVGVREGLIQAIDWYKALRVPANNS